MILARPWTHIHEEESAIEQGNREQVGTARGEGFAPALFRFLFQDGKKDTGIADYNTRKSKSLYKSSKIKTTNALIDGSMQEIAKSGKISQ